MSAIKSLEEILKENELTVNHLSWALRTGAALSDKFAYRAPKPRTASPSKDEKAIRKYLDDKGVNYEFERRIVVSEPDGIHIRMSDFYLKDYNVHIEYNGMEGDKKEEKRYQHKAKVYDANDVNYRVIHKHEFKSGEWKSKINYIISGKEERNENLFAAGIAVSLVCPFLLPFFM